VNVALQEDHSFVESRMTDATIPVEHDDPINAQILAISEDKLSGFQRQPFQSVSEQTGLEFDVVIERVRAMLAAGVIRRVRQTLLATKLAHGALVAWKVARETR